jgi:poly-gamma-glutamate synthesis protein (capsule biosynthesis protein)
MARVTIWGDFKANKTDRLSLSGDLTYLLNKSDVNIVNFEAPITCIGIPIRKSGPNISQCADSPEWLERYGFNLVSMANNHAMDFGKEGMNATMMAFQKASVIGCGTWEKAYRLKIVETADGLKVGFLACTHCEFGTLTDATSKDNLGTAWALAPDFEKAIQHGGDCCDFLIVIAHCGVEFLEQPLPEWRERYKRWIELGADAVIASHPHVPQGWEFYHGKPVCYSLGNFCFDRRGKKVVPQNWYNSLCCILDLDKQKEIRMTIRPIVFDAKTRYISDNTSDEFNAYLNRINMVLSKEGDYMDYVNRSVLQLLPHYMNQFSRGGLIHNPFSIGFVKGLAEGLLGRGLLKKEHWLNNLQCESHRWVIQRAVKLKEQR